MPDQPSSRRPWPPFPAHQATWDRLGLVVLHLAVVAGLILFRGVRFDSADYLASAWQFVALKELADHLGSALLDLWSQPPLYNLALGLALKAGRSHFPNLLWAWHLLWAGLAVWAVYGLIRHLSGRRWLALGLAGWLPAAPDWLLYESWSNYEFPTMAAGLVLVYLTCRFHRTRDWPTLLAVTGLLNLLMLTRSAYHLAFGLAYCAGLVLTHREETRKLLVGLILPVLLLTGGWYAKNLVRFGFFGASGWSNLNLMRLVTHDRTEEFLRAHLENTPQAYLVPVWKECPGFFCDLVDHYLPALDHPQKGDRPTLHDYFKENLDGTRHARNFNNINYLTVNRDCGAAAVRLIRADPWGYLLNVAQAYHQYCVPVTKYGYLKANRDRLEAYVRAWERLVYHPWPGPAGPPVPALYYLYPLALVGFVAGLVRLALGRDPHGRAFDDLAATGVVLFITLVSIMAEYGENHRFSFLILPLFTAWLIGRAASLVRPWRTDPSS
jgi:hypothetical protein